MAGTEARVSVLLMVLGRPYRPKFAGKGGLNLRAILDCMPVVPYSLEIPNDTLMKELGPVEFARRAIRESERYLAG